MTRIFSGKKKLAIGMIGLGFISHIHKEAYELRNDVYLKAISDSNQALLLDRGRAWGIKETYPDYRFMLKDKDIDIVDVMTPHYLHRKCVCDALKAGKIVICEKPIATTVKDVEEMIMVSQQTKKKVYLKQYLRFSECYKKARELIFKKGVVGSIYFTQCTFTGNSGDYTNPSTWRANTVEAGGGVLMDIGVHMIDLMSHFFGNPMATYTETRKVTGRLPQKGEDLVSLLLLFPRNMLANINCTQIDKGYGFRWEVRMYGSKGIITIIDKGKQEKVLQLIKGNRLVYELVEHDWWRKANIGTLHDIIERIYDKKEPAISLKDAKIIIKVVTSAYQSARLNRKIQIR